MSHHSEDDQLDLTLGQETPQETHDVAVPGPSTKKRYRPSKRDISYYPFTLDQQEDIAAFVQDNPVLYDKTHAQWSMKNVKEDLWKQLASHFLDCTWLQCRKFFEDKWTAFGKTEKKKQRKVAPQHLGKGLIVKRPS